MKPALLSFGVFAVAGIVGGGWWMHENAERTVILRDCEKVLLKRLRSPSTYKRIEASDVRREIATEDDYLYNNDPEEKARVAALGKNNQDVAESHQYVREIFAAAPMEKLTLTIEYDAENGFGSTIRGYSECAVFRHVDRPIERGDLLDTRVDGKSDVDWAMDNIRALSQ